jgi:hypothetical protein
LLSRKLISVSKWWTLSLFITLLAQNWAVGQSDPSQQPVETTQSTGAVPAMAQQPVPADSSQFPPLSSLDEGSLEPNAAARSFLAGAAQISESADTNVSNATNSGDTRFTGVTHLLGAIDLQKLWSRFQTSLGYVGGGALYAGSIRTNAQMHEVNFDARKLWRTGAIIFRDSAEYLPEGTFGGGGFGGLGIGSQGLGHGGVGIGTGGNRLGFFGQGLQGSLGTSPHVSNLSVVEVMDSLSPRSAVTLSGGFRWLHFTNNPGDLLLDSQQTTAQVGYNYQINRRNKVAIVYGFQHMLFPVAGAGSFESHVAHFVYGHQISGRMDLTLAAGPQLTEFHSVLQGNSSRLSASGRASLRYKFPRTVVSLSYDHFNTAGSGFFAGAESDIARAGLFRPIARRWEFSSDAGYSHNRRLLAISRNTIAGNATSYQDGFAGARLSRLFSRTIRGFVFYQFHELWFDRGFCGGASSGSCNHISSRHVAGVGLSWHPHAIRLD